MLQRRTDLKDQLKLARRHLKGGGKGGSKGGSWTGHGQQGKGDIQQLERDIAATQYGKEYDHRGDISSRVWTGMKSSRK